MANFGTIPSNVNLAPGQTVRRKLDDSDWEGADLPALSQTSVSRSLNTAFRPSVTNNSLVNYSVEIGTTLSLSGGQIGTVFLEIASDSGFTTNVQEINRFVNGNTGSLTLGLNIVQTSCSNLSGMVPAGYYARLRTANTTGTPTFTYRSGQETLV